VFVLRVGEIAQLVTQAQQDAQFFQAQVHACQDRLFGTGITGFDEIFDDIQREVRDPAGKGEADLVGEFVGSG
jgi:hypothetical protein